jgi:alpha/beta superfamily hydrolase
MTPLRGCYGFAMAPRPFERPATVALPEGPDGALVLDGLHVPHPEAIGGAVIAPPHPLYGGSMESPVVTEIAKACEHAGLESLRFNWRGVGASAGRATGDPAAAVADYAAALDWIEETASGPITACGYSFGAATAVRAVAGRPRVRSLLLVAPPPAMLDRALLEGFAGRLAVAVGQLDELAPAKDLEGMLESIPGARLEVIPDADHFFMSALPAVGRVARALLGARAGGSRSAV